MDDVNSQATRLRLARLDASLNRSGAFPVFEKSPVGNSWGGCQRCDGYMAHLRATLCELHCKITKKMLRNKLYDIYRRAKGGQIRSAASAGAIIVKYDFDASWIIHNFALI